jgi:acetyl-CoA carboxylase carboxyltransferase component
MAAYVEIDAVIDPADTRGWISRGLRSARSQGGSGRFVDCW